MSPADTLLSYNHLRENKGFLFQSRGIGTLLVKVLVSKDWVRLKQSLKFDSDEPNQGQGRRDEKRS